MELLLHCYTARHRNCFAVPQHVYALSLPNRAGDNQGTGTQQRLPRRPPKVFGYFGCTLGESILFFYVVRFSSMAEATFGKLTHLPNDRQGRLSRRTIRANKEASRFFFFYQAKR